MENTENKGRKDSGVRKQPTRPQEDTHALRIIACKREGIIFSDMWVMRSYPIVLNPPRRRVGLST
jgi:hypothetical protein